MWASRSPRRPSASPPLGPALELQGVKRIQTDCRPAQSVPTDQAQKEQGPVYALDEVPTSLSSPTFHIKPRQRVDGNLSPPGLYCTTFRRKNQAPFPTVYRLPPYNAQPLIRPTAATAFSLALWDPLGRPQVRWGAEISPPLQALRAGHSLLGRTRAQTRSHSSQRGAIIALPASAVKRTDTTPEEPQHPGLAARGWSRGLRAPTCPPRSQATRLPKRPWQRAVDAGSEP